MMYDYLFITNIPAFYKIRLYNSLSKVLKIKVLFISEKSICRTDDFYKGECSFDYEFVNSGYYEKRNKINSFFMVKRLLSNIKTKKIIFPGWESPELFPFMFVSPKTNNAIIIESSINDTVTKGWKWYLKKILISRISLAFPSGKLQNEILDKLNYKNDVRFTHGVGIANLIKCQQPSKDTTSIKKFLFVGRLSSEKNVNFMLDVFKKNGYSLTIVGDGPLSSVLFKKYCNCKNINFKGYVSNLDLIKLYQEFDVFVLPSLSEPWGLVVDEALMSGLPVVVSSNVGCRFDLVDIYNTGTVFDPLSKHSFQSALDLIILNYDVYKENVSMIDWQDRIRLQVNSYIN